jgi:hypothetical protein
LPDISPGPRIFMTSFRTIRKNLEEGARSKILPVKNGVVFRTPPLLLRELRLWTLLEWTFFP